MPRTKLDLTIWLQRIHPVSNDKRGRSALSISQFLGLNQKTARRLKHKIRRAMSAKDAYYQLANFLKWIKPTSRLQTIRPMVEEKQKPKLQLLYLQKMESIEQ